MSQITACFDNVLDTVEQMMLPTVETISEPSPSCWHFHHRYNADNNTGIQDKMRYQYLFSWIIVQKATSKF